MNDRLSQIIANLENSISELKSFKNDCNHPDCPNRQSSSESSERPSSSESSERPSSSESSAERPSSSESSSESSERPSSAESSERPSSSESSAERSSGEGFFLDSSKPSWPNLVWLDGDVSGSYLKTRSLFLTDGGKKLTCLPYKQGGGLEIDIAAGTIKKISTFPVGYIGQTLVSNGKEVSNPAWAKGFSVYSPESNSWQHGIGHQWQVRGTAEGEEGVIYGPQFMGGSSKVLWLDTNTNKFNVMMPPEDRVNYPFQGAWGAVSAKGRVFILPFASPYVGFIERGYKSRWEELKGHQCLGNGHPTHMYTHGRYHAESNLIVSLPRRSNAILTINPDTLEVKEIPLPQELINLFPQKAKSFDCEIGPDGWVYSSPWAHPVMFRFNPLTNEIDWKNMKEELKPARRPHQNPATDVDIIAAPDGYFTAMRRVGNEIYYGVAGGGKGLKLVF